MSMASNQSQQMAKRLKQDLTDLAPENSYALSYDVNNYPCIQVTNSSAAVIAQIRLNRRTMNGFQIVAELSSSAAQGYPEHEAWLAVDNTGSVSLTEMAKLSKAVAGAGASELKIVEKAGAPAQADLIDANVTASIPNDARIGSVGQ